MEKEEFEKQLIELWEEYSKSKNWWYSEDTTFKAFMNWLEKGKPNDKRP